MPKRKGKTPKLEVAEQRRLPKDALRKVSLGKSFAEYDPLLKDRRVYVLTPAIEAAVDPAKAACFFVGRRGTGKTATTLYLEQKSQNTRLLLPRQIVPTELRVSEDALRDTRQKPFRSLVEAFLLALLTEALATWLDRKLVGVESLPDGFRQQRHAVEHHEFDSRVLLYVDELLKPLAESRDRTWLKQINRSKMLLSELHDTYDTARLQTTLVIDRIDEAWDGSDRAVIFLMALMHACVQLTAATHIVRPLLFVRENIFERVRALDNEFARLETSVVSMDWTPELLRELVERRLSLPFTAKLSLHGETWDYFFAPIGDSSSFCYISEYCQLRPRDVLTFCGFAIENAVAARSEVVTADAVFAAKRRFSDSRLKDIGDEYAENFPHIGLILSRFYGLGHTFTYDGVLSFLRKLTVDEEVKTACKRWIFDCTAPERLMVLLYNIGFVGLGDGAHFEYRSMGARSGNAPKVTPRTFMRVHPVFWEALHSQEAVVTVLDDATILKTGGLVEDLPDGTTLDDYHRELQRVRDDLKTLPCGNGSASTFEDIVGDVVRLCLFRYLSNLEPQVRDVNNTQVRDWMCANIAAAGFWEMVRLRYNAVQVVWECKNYSTLSASDFQQAAYRMSAATGRFVIIAFRGEVSPHYCQHIATSVRDRDGMIMLVGERDLDVLLRQAINGKTRDTHLREVFDQLVRRL